MWNWETGGASPFRGEHCECFAIKLPDRAVVGIGHYYLCITGTGLNYTIPQPDLITP